MKNSNLLPKILIVGCGDIGVRVAQLEKQTGRQVSGLVRSEEGAERLRGHGIEPVMGTLDDLTSLSDLPTAGKLVYYFAPPTGGGPFDSRMRSFCQAVGAG